MSAISAHNEDIVDSIDSAADATEVIEGLRAKFDLQIPALLRHDALLGVDSLGRSVEILGKLESDEAEEFFADAREDIADMVLAQDSIRSGSQSMQENLDTSMIISLNAVKNMLVSSAYTQRVELTAINAKGRRVMVASENGFDDIAGAHRYAKELTGQSVSHLLSEQWENVDPSVGLNTLVSGHTIRVIHTNHDEQVAEFSFGAR